VISTKEPGKPGTTVKKLSSHRIVVPLLVFLGALCILISTVSVWVRDLALDPDNWADTSSQLLQSQDVRDVLSVYIVDQAYSASDAEARLEGALPPRLQPLAPQLAAQIRAAAYRVTSEALARPRVQELWRSANRATNAQIVALLEGGGKRVQLTGDAVVLDLDQIVQDVAGQIGVGQGATQAVQDQIQPIVVIRADQLTTAQKIVKVLKALSFWPLILALLLWAAAVYLGHGRRRECIRAAGISLLILGLLLLALIRIGGHLLVDNLVQTDSVMPAAEDVWSVFTQLLAASAWAGIAVGVVTLVGTWVSGPTIRATAVRRWLAPGFREQPLVPHMVLAALMLLVLVWGPTGTPRRAITLVIVVALAFIGLEVFRRRTVEEFPDAVRGDTRLFSRLRRGSTETPADASSTSRLDRLERLAALHDRGALTDEEYEAEKALAL
jgi:hypothetical protein